MENIVLDVCCGSKMFYFDKSDNRAVFCDARNESHILCDGRNLEIKPDLITDFKNLPFENEKFSVVVFDPPHLINAGENSWLNKKYGKLNKNSWRDDIKCGFAEAFRVLKKDGVLIFKWNETQIPISKIISLTDKKPIIFQRTGKSDKTHWIIFIK